MASTWMVYMVLCADNSIYTGITTDIERRLKEHNQGKLGAHYTKSRRPVQLLHSEMQATRSAALVREAAIKKLPREKKLELVKII